MATLNEPRRRKPILAALAVVAGVALLALELARPPGGTTVGERWFWIAVGVLLVTLGVGEYRSRREGKS